MTTNLLSPGPSRYSNGVVHANVLSQEMAIVADPEHVQIVSEGASSIERWRHWHSDVSFDLSDAKLVFADLHGADLSGADLSGANLVGADLRGADFGPANLTRAELAGTNLNRPNLIRAKLAGADLSKANLTEAHLSFANLTGAHLSRANLSKAKIRGSNLTKADLREADLRDVDLRRAKLSGANLFAADLSGANLFAADLSGANLFAADLSGALLIKAKLSEANLAGANLVGACLSSVAGEGAKLDGANLTGARFTPKGILVDVGSFLDLSTCEGIETAIFDRPDFLQDYLTLAFKYAHDPSSEEVTRWPSFVCRAIERIKALQVLLRAGDPPSALIEAIQTITAELIRYLAAHPKALYEIKPRQFEELIAEILASYGWDVHLTPASKDGGYDLFAISQDVSGVRTSWIIECKKYKPEHKVGVEIVRALFGVKADLRVANAMLATTSHFTRGVRDLKASHYDLELRDYEGILEWLNEYHPNPDGKLFIRDHKLVLPE